MKSFLLHSNGRPFARLMQYAPEGAGVLTEKGHWQASMVGWGALTGDEMAHAATAREAWQALAAKRGPLEAHDDLTSEALCGERRA